MLKKSNATYLILSLPLIAFIFRMFVFTVMIVEGDSMLPNLKDGDWVFVNLWSKEYNPGDVVVFRGKDGAGPFIKRIVGSNGDAIYIDNYKLHRNGLPIESISSKPRFGGSYLVKWDRYDLNCKYSDIYSTKLGEYFLLGDNRCYSSDSRVFGPVKKPRIIGKIIRVLKFSF